MSKLTAFLSIGLFLALSEAQQDPCISQVNQYLQCVKSAEDNAKSSFQQLKQQGQACFTSNGCNVPQKPHWGGKGKGHHGGEKEINQTQIAQWNQTRACKNATEAYIKQRVDQCVQGVTGLTVAIADGHKAFFDSPQHSGGGGRGSWGPGSNEQGGGFPRGPGGSRGPESRGPGGNNPCEGAANVHFDFPAGGFKQMNGGHKQGGFQKFIAEQACNTTNVNDTRVVAVSSCLAALQNSSQQQVKSILDQLNSTIQGTCKPLLVQGSCNFTNLFNVKKQARCARHNCSIQVEQALNASGQAPNAVIPECSNVATATAWRQGHGGPKGKGGPKFGGHFGKEHNEGGCDGENGQGREFNQGKLKPASDQFNRPWGGGHEGQGGREGQGSAGYDFCAPFGGGNGGERRRPFDHQ